jgi:rhodanese-related sulfurtransferase
MVGAMPMRLVVLFLFSALSLCAADVPRIKPTEAAQLVADGKAILVDVREPAEWFATGVAAPAVLLPQSDFEHEQFEWKPFLEKTGKDKTLVLYCRSGRRAGSVGATLAEKGLKVVNAGGLQEWVDAGLPTRQLEPKK